MATQETRGVQESYELREERRKRNEDFLKFAAGWDACNKDKPKVSPQSWTMAERKLFLRGYKAAEESRRGE